MSNAGVDKIILRHRYATVLLLIMVRKYLPVVYMGKKSPSLSTKCNSLTISGYNGMCSIDHRECFVYMDKIDYALYFFKRYQ